MAVALIHVLAPEGHGYMTRSRSADSLRLFRAIRDAALIVGAARGMRRDPGSGTQHGAADLTDEHREILDRLERRPWLMFAPLATLRILLRVALRLMPLTIVGLAYGLGTTWAPSQAGKDYFSAAAQVIPVLLLALAVESQMLSFRALFVFQPMPLYSPRYREVLEITGANEDWMLRAALWLDESMGWLTGWLNAATALLGGLAVLFALAQAEWECLSILASLGDGKQDPARVSGGILAGLVGVGLLALIGRRK
jgi:hypothetical protein